MHEVSYAEQIFKLVKQYAANQKAKKVLKVYLTVSAMSGIEPDSFRFYWDILTKETELSESKIYIQKTSAHLICKSCKKEFDIKDYSDPYVQCPFCQKINTVVSEDTSITLNKIIIEK